MKKLRPEIIAKLGFTVDADGTAAYPMLSLLCDRDGYLWLSKFFADCARHHDKFTSMSWQDDHDHAHLETSCSPFNTEMSDLLEIRVASLFPSQRHLTLGYYDASTGTAKKGDLKSTFEKISQAAAVALEREREIAALGSESARAALAAARALHDAGVTPAFEGGSESKDLDHSE